MRSEYILKKGSKMAIVEKIEKVRDELIKSLTASQGAQRADAVALALSQKKVAALTVENAKLQEIIIRLKSELDAVRRSENISSPSSPRTRKAAPSPKTLSPWREDEKDRQQLFAALDATSRKL